MSEPTHTIVAVATVVVMLAGVIGTIAVGDVGIIVVFLAALGYALLDGFHVIGWPTLVVLGLLALAAITAEIWVSSMGAKVGGASGWSVLAGLVGGVIGFVLFSLPGSILGAVAAVVLTELLRLRDWKKAAKSGGGWLAGWLVGVVLRLSIGLTMIAIFVWQVVQG